MIKIYRYVSALALILEVFTAFASTITNQGWPPCANLTFSEKGTVDIGKTLYNCINNIPSSQFPPSYYDVNNVGFQPLNVSVQFAINNLINVDDLQCQMTIDFYFRCAWQDPRIFIPDMWQYLNPQVRKDGIVITPLVQNANTPLNLWLPDFYFLDSTQEEEIVETIKLLQNGSLYWSRHLVVTFSQPAMNFHDFPLDSQNFSIRFQSFSFDSDLLRINLTNPAVVLLGDPQNDNQDNIAMNVLWRYNSWSAFVENSYQPIAYNPDRYFWVGYVNLKFTRESSGIIYRLGLPVTICLIVVGFAFWSTIEKRIEVTLQMFLVAAALYLVIGQIIPFVGYLTTMDFFVTTVFVCLAATIGLHFFSLLIEAKEEFNPMNLFYRVLLNSCLRVMWIPLAFAAYIGFFDIKNVAFDVLLALFCAVLSAYGFFRIDRVKESFEFSIRNLREKEKYCQHFENAKEEIIKGGAFGEKFVKHVKLNLSERLLLSLCANYYREEPHVGKKKKYLHRYYQWNQEVDRHVASMNASSSSSSCATNNDRPVAVPVAQTKEKEATNGMTPNPLLRQASDDLMGSFEDIEMKPTRIKHSQQENR